MLSPSAYAQVRSGSDFPAGLERKLTSLCGVDDGFLRYAALNELKRQYKLYRSVIEVKAREVCAAQQVVSGEGVEKAAKSSLPSWLQNFKGEVEAGLDWRTGNTELTQYNVAGKLVQDLEYWRNTANASLISSEEDGVSIAEQYRAGFDTNYKLNKRDYLFGTLRYVDDRFSGFEWRLTETAGLGRRWIDDDVYLLDTRIGPGFRQSELKNGDKENDWLIQFVADAGWHVNDYFELSEKLSYEYSPAAGILNSETAVKSRITDTLSFKTGIEVQHITDVPADTQKTDTRTTAGIIYEFLP